MPSLITSWADIDETVQVFDDYVLTLGTKTAVDAGVTRPFGPREWAFLKVADEAQFDAEVAARRTQLAAQAAAAQTIRTVATNRDALRTKLAAALSVNAAYLALASTSTAQNTAQIKALTRQVTALARIVAEQLTDTTGT